MLENIVTIFKRLTERQVFSRQLHVSVPMPSTTPIRPKNEQGDVLRRQLRWATGHVFLAGLEGGVSTVDTLATMLSELSAISLANADRPVTIEMLRMALETAKHIEIDTNDVPYAPPQEECGRQGVLAFLDRMVEGGTQCAIAATEGVGREAMSQRAMLIATGLMAETLGWNATLDALAELMEYAREQAEAEGQHGGARLQ